MPHVLVVDDDPDIGRLFQRQLMRAGYDATYVPDASTALAMVMVAPPDLLLLDVHMPDLDGINFVRALWDRTGTVLAPIVLTSVDTAVRTDAERLASRGVVAFLQKPFAREELLSEVRKSLGQPN